MLEVVIGLVVGNVIGSAFSGLIGNRADALAMKRINIIKDNFNRERRLINHDLQKAVSVSFCSALISICKECLLNVRDNRELEQWLKTELETWKDESKAIEINKYRKLRIDNIDDIKLLIATDEKSRNDLKEIENKLVKEILSREDVPACYRKKVEELFITNLCGYFASEIKDNQRISNIFQSQILSNLDIEVKDLHKLFESSLQTLIDSMNKLVNDVEVIKKGMLDIIKTTVNGNFIKDGETIEFNRIKSVEKLIINYTMESHFVGREKDLCMLDGVIEQPGYHLISAPAGAGKTTLLAYFVKNYLLKHNPGNICYYFFSTTWGFNDLNGFLACFAEELLKVLNIKGDIRESEPNKLRGVITQILSMPHESPLIVVIDGLDEISNSQQNLHIPIGIFPRELGQDITVIFSIRSIYGKETLNLLEEQLGITDVTQHFLDDLSEQAIKELLIKTKNSFLLTKADDLEFIRRVFNKTGGNAIYLHHLVEEFKHCTSYNEIDSIVNEIPSEFNDYIKKVVPANRGIWREVFRFLSVAKGPLHSDDLLNLSEISGIPLQPEDLDSIPWEVQRWLMRWYENWSFQHPTIAEAYDKMYITRVREKYNDYFINYCKQWQKHRSKYAFRYYIDHLINTAHKELSGINSDIYNLARDRAYRKAQAYEYPQDISLPLTTIYKALNYAAEVDDPGRMAEFLLEHTDCIADLYQESPLEVLRSGNVERALHLADMCSAEFRIMWRLVFAWELNESDSNPEKAREIIKGLAEQEFSVDIKSDEFLVYLIGVSYEIDYALFGELAKHLLKNYYGKHLITYILNYENYETVAETAGEFGCLDQAYMMIAKEYIVKNKFETATETALKISDPIEKVSMLADIGLSCFQNDTVKRIQEILLEIIENTSDNAQKVVLIKKLACIGEFDQILIFTEELDKWDREEIITSVLSAHAERGDWEFAYKTMQQYVTGDNNTSKIQLSIVKSLAECGEFIEAYKMASRIKNDIERIDAFVEIALGQNSRGISEDTIESFTAALQVVTGSKSSLYGDSYLKAKALIKITESQIYCGQQQAAIINLKAAIEYALITDRTGRNIVIRDTAVVLAKAGEVALSQETVKYHDNNWDMNQTKGEITGIYANTGNFSDAWYECNSIDNNRQRAHAMLGISISQSKRSISASARDTIAAALKLLNTDHDRKLLSDPLEIIANAQVQMGEISLACQTLEKIKDKQIVENITDGIIRQLIQSDGYQTAVEVSYKFNSYDRKINNLLDIAEVQLVNKDEEGASNTVALIKKEANIDSLDLLLREHLFKYFIIEKSDWDLLIEKACQIKDDYKRNNALSHIIKIQIEAGDYTGAIAVSNLIKENGKKVDELVEIAGAVLRSKNTEFAESVFSQALELLFSDVCPKFLVIKNIAEEYSLAGEYSSAINVAKLLTPEGQDQKLGEVSINKARDNKPLEAIKIASRIGNNEYKNKVYDNIAVILSEGDHYKGLLKDLENKFNREDILTVTAISSVQNYKLESTLATAELIEDYYLRVVYITKVINLLDNSKYIGDISNILCEAIKYTKQLKKDNWKLDRATILIADAQCQVGDFNGSLETIDSLLKVGTDSYEIINRIVISQVEAGDYISARKTADLIENSFLRRKTLYKIDHFYEGEKIFIQDKSSYNEYVRILSCIARIQAGKGDKDIARITIQDVLKKYDPSNPGTDIIEYLIGSPLEDLIIALSIMKDFDEAINLTFCINYQFRAIDILLKIASYQSEAGIIKGKLSALALAKEKASTIKMYADYKFKGHPLAKIALTEAELGEFETAVITAQKIEEVNKRVDTLLEIAVLKSHQNQNESLRIFTALQENLPFNSREEMLAKISVCMARAGFFAEAVQIAEKIAEASETFLIDLLYELARKRSLVNFKRVFMHFAYIVEPGIICKACGLLVSLYPEVNSDVIKMVQQRLGIGVT